MWSLQSESAVRWKIERPVFFFSLIAEHSSHLFRNSLRLPSMLPWWHLHKHIAPKRGKWGLMPSNYLWFMTLFDRFCTGHIYSALILIIPLSVTLRLVCLFAHGVVLFFSSKLNSKPRCAFLWFLTSAMMTTDFQMGFVQRAENEGGQMK